MMRSTLRVSNAAAIAAAIGIICVGCETTTRVISVRGGLQNIEGAEGGIRPDAPNAQTTASLEAVASRLYGPLPGTPIEGNTLRRELENGDILLVSRSPAELVFHLRRTIRDEEWELLYQQLLSEQLKNAYEERGLQPTAALDFVKEYARAITELLTMIPAGDQTPGAGFERIGRNAYRITIPGGRLNETTFVSMDVVYEDKSFKLRMLD